MATKKAPKKKATKAAAKKKTSRQAIPYPLIAKMVQEGADALSIAQKIGRVNAGKDKTHTVRAILSAMRSRGWKDQNGKVQKLKVERVGRVEKTKKAKKKTAAKKAAPKPDANAPTQMDGGGGGSQ